MTFDELLRLLKTSLSVEEIDCKREDIAELIPQVRYMFDFDQEHEAHQYDLWMHSLHTVVNLQKGINDNLLYLASFAEFQKLMQLQVADAKAHVLLPRIEKKIEICGKLAGEYGVELYKRILMDE